MSVGPIRVDGAHRVLVHSQQIAEVQETLQSCRMVQRFGTSTNLSVCHRALLDADKIPDTQ